MDISEISLDEYFLNIANAVSWKSRCLSRKLGCIIVNDKQILSTGYNGPPAGYPHCNNPHERMILYEEFYKEYPREIIDYRLDDISICPRKFLGFESGEGLNYCPAVHAELNAIIHSAKHGASIKGATLYCNFNIAPCRECAKAIINSGISKVVLSGTSVESYDREGLVGLDMLKRCNVEVVNG